MTRRQGGPNKSHTTSESCWNKKAPQCIFQPDNWSAADILLQNLQEFSKFVVIVDFTDFQCKKAFAVTMSACF